jgi:hypothetical protein
MKNSAKDPPSHKATANRAPDYSRRLSKDLKLTRFPNSLAATLRGFTFYLADPTRSLAVVPAVLETAALRTAHATAGV